MKYLILQIALCFSLSVFSQEFGNFKVHSIHDGEDFYLIFLIKGKEKFTIYSEKKLSPFGKTVEKGSIYFFELTQLADPVCGMNPFNPHITYFNKFTGDQIWKLYEAQNLIGLKLLIPSSE